MPDPDLLIRTAGEMRVSNFLLWQISYAELWVTARCWPDFDRATLHQALRDYAGRERRFGGLSNPAFRNRARKDFGMLRTRLWMGAILITLTVGMLFFDERFAPYYPILFVFFLAIGVLGTIELLNLLAPAFLPSRCVSSPDHRRGHHELAGSFRWPR